MKKGKLTDFCDKIIEGKLLGALDVILHLIIFLLIIATLGTIFIEMYKLFVVELITGNVRVIIEHILFTFILIELFTILHSYLIKHYIKVERIIEVGIISVVREIVFQVFEIEVSRIYALAVLLIALGALFFIEKHFSKERNV